MKKSFFYMLLAILPLAWGCGSDDDDPIEPQKPTDKQLTVGNDERPTSWEDSINYNNFELTMAVQFRLQDVLNEYVSGQDLLCALIGDEVRAVTAPEISEGQIYFPLVIAATSNESMVSIAYYCDKLKRIFTIDNWHRFDTSLPPLDNGEPYLLEFITTEEESQE